MKCPVCGERTHVYDSRYVEPTATEREPYVRRHRECLADSCKHRFTTFECTHSPLDILGLVELLQDTGEKARRMLGVESRQAQASATDEMS